MYRVTLANVHIHATIVRSRCQDCVQPTLVLLRHFLRQVLCSLLLIVFPVTGQ